MNEPLSSGVRHNFDWITDDLAVGGGFPSSSAESLAREHRVGAVIDLREEECDDETLLSSYGILFLHLPTPDVCAVSDAHLDAGVEFAREMQTTGRRLLIHCMHGIGRSATMALCVLSDRGENPIASLKAMKRARSLISPSPEQFECWARWLRRHGSTAPDFDEFARVAYAPSGQAA